MNKIKLAKQKQIAKQKRIASGLVWRFRAMLIPFFINYIFKKTDKILDLKLSDMTGMNIVYIIFYLIVNYYLFILWLVCLANFYDLIVSA